MAESVRKIYAVSLSKPGSLIRRWGVEVLGTFVLPRRVGYLAPLRGLISCQALLSIPIRSSPKPPSALNHLNYAPPRRLTGQAARVSPISHALMHCRRFSQETHSRGRFILSRGISQHYDTAIGSGMCFSNISVLSKCGEAPGFNGD